MIEGLVLGLVGLALLGLVALWATGRFVRLRQGRPSRAIPPGSGAPLDAPGLAGARLIPSGPEALALRRQTTQLARRSLDLMVYHWEDDLTGRLLAQDLLAAADRGVRVRLLLDDVHVLGTDRTHRALDRHPRIEVRLFNPIRSRRSRLLRGIEILLAFLPYNRRMHGKLWLADGRVALTGGRNVGDAYFGTSDGRRPAYDDLDILIAGPGVDAFATLFDRFWNAPSALPLRSLLPRPQGRLARFRARMARYLAEPANAARLDSLKMPEDPLLAQPLHPDPGLRVIADPPEKALGHRREAWVPQELLPVLRGARHSLRILTPYCVPGRQGLAELIALRQRGVAVEVITNALCVADNLLVHGAWAWYRARLLAAGVRVIELAPGQGAPRMLHAKALLADAETAFVGSFNFDMRSAFLNTELGVLTRHPALVADLRTLLDGAADPASGWTLQLQGRRTLWQRGARQSRHEPDTTALRRLISAAIGHLPGHRFL